MYSWQISAGTSLLKSCEFFANHNAEFSSRSLSDVTQSVILARSKAPLGKFSKFSYKISESIKFSKFFIIYKK
jgi:hypothetical protein